MPWETRDPRVTCEVLLYKTGVTHPSGIKNEGKGEPS